MSNKYEEEFERLKEDGGENELKSFLRRMYELAVFGDSEALQYLSELLGEIEDGDGDLNDNENEY
jgi:hypothetical protein